MKEITLPSADFTGDLWEMLARDGRPILVYGMGNGGDKLVSRLAAIGREVADFFASDGFVRGQSFHGKRVLTFREAKEKHERFVILVSFGSTRREVLDTVYGLAQDYPLYIPDMPLAGEEYFTAEFYRAHYGEIARVYGMLADEASRRVYAALVWYKLTGDGRYLRIATETGDEHALLSYGAMTSAVDVGAYRGDTLAELLESAPALSYVLAIEPDAKNYRRLCDYAKTVTGCKVETVMGAALDETGTVLFATSGNRNATVQGGKKGGTASHEYRVTEVNGIEIDNIIRAKSVDYIKYDTEGAELLALRGSRGTILAHRPHLRVSIYHRSEDLYALPLWLAEFYRDAYRYYIRRKPCIPAWECELIAVPVEGPDKEGENDA